MGTAFIISYALLGFSVVSTSVLAFFWREYYVIYDHRILFVVGLVFSRSLTNSSIISVLMWYFSYYQEDLVMSAVLSNIQDSLSSLLVIFMAHASDSFFGRFRTLLFSTTAYIGGLMLLWMFNPYDVKWLIVVALVLLALGTSGGILLEDVLIDLVNRIDKSPERTQERSLARATMWWRLAHVSGAISATLWVVPGAVGGVQPSWKSAFLICIISMVAALMIFCKGHNIYHQDKLTERPLEIFIRVCRARIGKLLKSNSQCLGNVSRQERQQNVETERRNEGITKERSPLRLGTAGQEYRGNNAYTKEEMMVVKSLSRLFPMWGSFFVVSLISATGSTFFFEQYSNVNTNDIPIQIYSLIQDLSSFAIPFLYRWICCIRQNEKVKIGAGMLCSIVCCVFAWQLEVHRLKKVKNLVDQDANTSISFLWLAPQFCLLGCMEGLTQKGLLKFFESQIDEPMKSYGEEYIEIVVGLGKLLNIFLILIFKSKLGWFRDTINDSRLDKYYRLLVYVCSANFVIYCCIATCFYKDGGRDQDTSADDLPEDDVQEPLAELQLELFDEMIPQTVETING